MHLSLRSKILAGTGLVLSLSVGASAFTVMQFGVLAEKMQILNEVYIPSTKTLSQIDNQFFIVEQDIDRALTDGKVRPKTVDLQALGAKIEFLRKLQNRVPAGSDLDHRAGIAQLGQDLVEVELSLPVVYSGEAVAQLHKNLEQARVGFRHNLYLLSKNMDRDARLLAITVEAKINKSAIVATLLVAAAMIAAMILLFVVALSLGPLRSMTEVVQAISKRGLSLEDAKTLELGANRRDELGILAKEFVRMLSSLKDRTARIDEQNRNLERAHLELAKQNMDLRRTQTKLIHQEKLVLVGKMSAQVAHEIRNPLNAMGLHLDLLEVSAGDRGSKNSKSMAALRKELDRLSVITDEYLNLAKRPRLERFLCTINELVAELAELYKPLLSEQAIELKLDLCSKNSVKVDKQQILQVMGNLLKNASESFSAENKSKVITLKTEDSLQEGSVVFSVADNGAGICQEVASEVFSPFFTTKNNGTGLGLAYSRQLVEAHGGSLGFASKVGEGTMFTMRIPTDGVTSC